MLCDPGSFIWIKQVEIGVSEHYTDDGNGVFTCPKDEMGGCMKSNQLEANYVSIGYKRFGKITVDSDTVMCNGEETDANFMFITFCCIEGEKHWLWFYIRNMIKLRSINKCFVTRSCRSCSMNTLIATRTLVLHIAGGTVRMLVIFIVIILLRSQRAPFIDFKRNLLDSL